MDDDATPQPVGGRPLAILAFVLAITSLLLAWWRITWTTGGAAIHDDVRAFRPEEPLTTAWGPWLTGLLVVAAILLLFVRIAARSDRHEPASWRRDLALAAGLLGAAVLSALLWPADVPAFWGGRTLSNETITSGANAIVETAMPGLGWWLGMLSALLCLAAFMRARANRAAT